jgi:hypothetical protein
LAPKKLFKNSIEIFEFLGVSSKGMKDKSLDASSKYVERTTKSSGRCCIKLLNKEKLKKSINGSTIILYCDNLDKKGDLFVIDTALSGIDIKYTDINDDEVIEIPENDFVRIKIY